MSDATTLDQLRRQAERRGLRIEYRKPFYLVRLIGARIPIVRTRESAQAAAFIESFRGGGR